MPDGLTWIGISPFLSSTVESRYNLDYKLKNWDFIELELTEEQLQKIRKLALQKGISTNQYIHLLIESVIEDS